MLGLFFRPETGMSDSPAQWMPAVSSTVAQCDFAKAGLGKGFMRVQSDGSNVITVVDCELDKPLFMSGRMTSDVIHVRAALETDCAYAPEGSGTLSFSSPGVTVTAFPGDTWTEILMRPGKRQRAVTVFIPRDSIAREFGHCATELPSDFRHFGADGIASPQCLTSFPIDHEIAGAVTSLVTSNLPGALRMMHADARAKEVVALTLASWNGHGSAEACSAISLREQQIAYAALKLLSENFRQPPTIVELALRLGTNKNKLNRIFKEAVGMTPQLFCVHKRMERAKKLLLQGRSIGEVAAEVGYQHHSSFTSIFTDTVGRSPKQFRLEMAEPSADRHALG
jgi:AraC-like DNA-binding protein